MVVGSIFKDPELLVEYSRYVRSKYDFADEGCKFFYDCAELIFEKRSQTFNKPVIASFMTEDNDRLGQYKRLGGWKTLSEWMTLSEGQDFGNNFDVLKKYSLLREYERRGFNVERIMSHKNFEKFSSADIYKLMRGQVDKIKTVILAENNTEVLNSNTQKTITDCLIKPDQGVPYPFPEWNETFRGQRMGNMMLLGMLSNGGKSRLLCKIVAYNALVNKQNVLVMLNEMSIQEFRFALITTVINNPEYEKLHGVHLKKKEREITLGVYHDTKGNVIEREHDDDGKFTESVENYVNRLERLSEEFVYTEAVTKWIDEYSEGKIICKDIQSDYSNATVNFEIRRAAMVNNIKFVCYDTLKPQQSSIGEWAEYKSAVTTLSELAKELKINLLASFQLSDDAALIDPMDFTSNQIANSKQIIHLTDSMVAFAEVPIEKYSKYEVTAYAPDWGAQVAQQLNPDKRYYICTTMKNRAGNKPKWLFSLNLDLNTWFCEGIVTRKFIKKAG